MVRICATVRTRVQFRFRIVAKRPGFRYDEIVKTAQCGPAARWVDDRRAAGIGAARPVLLAWIPMAVVRWTWLRGRRLGALIKNMPRAVFASALSRDDCGASCHGVLGGDRVTPRKPSTRLSKFTSTATI